MSLECGPETSLKAELGRTIKEALLERINLQANPLALALRISACQLVGIDSFLYRQDMAQFMSLHDQDRGWPADHLCCIGRTGARIDNKVLATALAIKIISGSAMKNWGFCNKLDFIVNRCMMDNELMIQYRYPVSFDM